MRVAVFGAGHTALSAIRSLVESRVVDIAVFTVDKTAESTVRWERPGMPIAYVDSSRVADGQWLGEADICLLASDSIDAPLCLAVNSACVNAGVKLIPGLGMGDIAQVGPLIEAGVGPCLQCLTLRVEAALGRPALVGPYPPNLDLGERVGRYLASLATDESGRGQAVVYMWSDGRAEEHLALRSYDCPACGKVEPTAPHASRPVGPFATDPGPDDDRILSLEPLIVDRIMGVVRWVTDYVAGPHEPDIAHAVASVADRRWDHVGVEIYAGGNDLDRRQARAAALGEALDRLASSPPGPGSLKVGRFSELGDHAADPRLFDLFHDEIRARTDFPYGPIDAETELSWVWSWSLGEARPKLVPAARVFLPLDTGLAGDMPDAGNVSGAATSSTPASAILAGLLEVIERDTFMIAWANRLAMTGVAIDASTESSVGRYVGAFNQVGVEVRCSTITLDWDVPLVVALARSERVGDPAVVVSAAAATDLATACRRALKELSANLAFVRTLLRGQPQLPSPDPRMVRTPEAHALLYANPDMIRHLEAWWAPEKTTPLVAAEMGGDQGHLQAIVDRVMRHDTDVLAVDLTLPGLAERGLWTYKTLVPGAYPMNFDSLWPQLGGKRLINAPVEAGVTTHPLTPEDLNSVPHPFP